MSDFFYIISFFLQQSELKWKTKDWCNFLPEAGIRSKNITSFHSSFQKKRAHVLMLYYLCFFSVFFFFVMRPWITIIRYKRFKYDKRVSGKCVCVCLLLYSWYLLVWFWHLVHTQANAMWLVHLVRSHLKIPKFGLPRTLGGSYIQLINW